MENGNEDSIIKAVENIITEIQPYNPVVRRNHHNKTVTADIALDLPDRPVLIKIIAEYDKWYDIAWSFLEKTWITFEGIEPFIFRLPKQDRKDIRAAWNKDMAYRVYHAAEAACNLIRPKAKGRHIKQEHRTGDIVRVSRHVYVFLEHWLCYTEGKWPKELISFLKDNRIYDKYQGSKDPVQLTKEIVECHFDIIIGAEDDPEKITEYFNRHYIHCKTGVPLSMLQQSYEKIGYLPVFYPLKEVFKPVL